MRAICGAIITAGAVIGLGWAANAFTPRYSFILSRVGSEKAPTLTRDQLLERFHEVDTPMMYIVVFLTCVAIIGLAITFFGLAYHHYRRHHEHLREEHRLAGHQRTPV